MNFITDNASQVLRNTSQAKPDYSGYLRKVDKDPLLRESVLTYALDSYGYLVPRMAVFRLDYLGMLIAQTYDQSDPRHRLIADLCLINGDFTRPILRTADGSFRQF